MKHLEIESFEHKGISVNVKLDYHNKTISLVEVNKNSTPVSYPGKQWVFVSREVEYMDGWLQIFEAMAHATKEAKKRMTAFLKEQEDKAIDMVDEMQDAVKKIGEKHNKKNR